MSIRDTLLPYFDPDGGLRCLPRFWKHFCAQLVETLPEEVLEPYAAEWLPVLVQYIEPLAVEAEDGGHPHFVAVCRALETAAGFAEIAIPLNLDVPTDLEIITWVQWADELQLQPAACLYCLASWWALPLPPGQMPADLEAAVLTLTSQSLHNLGPSAQAAMLLESHLGLRPAHYSNHQALGRALADSPLRELEANNRANFLCVLADALRREAGRGSGQAAMLLEAYLNGPVERFAGSEVFRDVTINNQLAYLTAWFRAVGPEDARVESVCEAIVEHIRTIRDSDLPTYQLQKNFYLQIGNAWGELRTLLLSRADWLRRNGPNPGAEDLEQRLIVMAEQFENRLLLPRMLDMPIGGEDGADLLAGWQPGRKALQRDSLVDAHRFREHLPPADPYASPQALVRPLTALGSTAPDTGQEVSPPVAGGPRNEELAKLIAEKRTLEELVPPGVVWVRTLFDAKDRVRWWALRQGPNGVEVVEQGRSKTAGARQRLEQAVQGFDLHVELIWNRYMGLRLDDFLRARLPLVKDLESFLSEENRFAEELPSEPKREEFRSDVEAALLKKDLMENWPQWTVAALRLLRYLFRPEEERAEPPPVPLEKWRQALVDNPAPKGDNDWRLAELDAATDRLVAAVARELDLAPLWQTAGKTIPWGQTDVLFQVQGPLLAAPLAWLPFGGKPLFEQVASTGSVVSLTLRYISAREANQAGPPAPALLSAQWLDKEDWERMCGPAYLEAALHRLAQGQANGWDFWGLGDAPRASAAHLRAALNAAARRYALVVVGGHGNQFEAGVKLADGLWKGEHADLSRLDLLILVACAVGRLRQSGDRDVEGLYAQLVGHRGRSVLAARWPIADTEAATFIAELVRQYMEATANPAGPEPFFRARALNRARKAALQAAPGYRVSRHLAAAFEIYGLG